MTVVAFHHAFHGIVGKTVLHRITHKRLLAVAVHHAFVEPVAVAAHPDGAVVGLTERGDLVYNPTFRTVQLPLHGGDAERTLAVAARRQVDLPQTGKTAHPQLSVLVDQRTDAAPHVAASLVGLFQLPCVEAIEVNTAVASYPKTIVDGVVGQGAYIVDDVLIGGLHRQRIHLVRVVHVEHAHTTAPGAYPQPAIAVGSQCRY